MKCKYLGFAAALLAAAPVSAAEEIVRIESDLGTIVGTLATPDGEAAPVVLLLHGFTGVRDELAIVETEEGVLQRTARLLAEAGYASLRIDFRGSGDSDGAWQETTFSGQAADAVAAIDWLRGSDAVDGSRLAILGWSQGGLVALESTRQRSDVDALILWAPVVHPLHSYESLLGVEETAQALAADDPTLEITSTLPWGVETTLQASFWQEMPLTSPSAAAAGYDGPLMVIVGTRDTIVAPQPASGQVLIDYHNGPEELAVFDTDHVWDVFSGPETLDTLMVPTSLSWLEAHL